MMPPAGDQRAPASGLRARARALLRALLATRLRRRLAIAAVAVVFAVLLGVGGAVGLLMWRLEEGPIRLDSLDVSIEAAVARELGEVTVDVLGAELARSDDGSIVIRLADITIRDLSGQFLARAPQAMVTTGLISAALGSVNPTRIELIGPHVTVNRSQDGDISFGFRAVSPPATDRGGRGRARDDAQRGARQAADQFAEQITRSDGDGPRPDGVDGQNARDERSQPEPSQGQGDIAPGEPPATSSAEPVDDGPTFSPIAMFTGGTGDENVLGNLNHLLVRDARLTLFDEASQSVWESYDASLQITRPGGGLAVLIDAPFSTDTGEWRFVSAIEQDAADTPVLIEASFDNIVPSEIAARIPVLTELSSFDLPVSGHFQATVSAGGHFEAVSGDIRLGAGFVRRIPFLDVSIAPHLIDEGRIAASYNRGDNEIALENLSVQIGESQVSLSGTISPELTDAGTISAARFDLRSQNIVLAAADLDVPPAVIERALASGRILLDRSAIEVDTVIAELQRGRLTFGATTSLDDEEAITVQGAVEDLPVASLVQLWPANMAPGARRWIGHHLRSGLVRHADVRVALDGDDLVAASQGGAMSDDAIDVSMALEGVTANYLEPLPPLRNAAGSAFISGDRFVLSLDGAEAEAPGGDPIAITYGRFEVPSFVENEQGYIDGRLNVGISSSTAAALQVLDMEPLEFSREIGIDLASVAGHSTIIFDLAIPLVDGVAFEEITFQAGATVHDLEVADAFRSMSLGAEELEIIATPRRIDARGQVRLNDVPASAVWEVRFDDTGQRANRLAVQTEADSEALGRLGIDIGDFLKGSFPVTLEATGSGTKLDHIEVSSNVTPARIDVPAIGWAKPAGEPAKLDFVVERLANEQVRLREIRLDGDRVNVEGAIRFDPDGSVYKVDISRLRMGATNNLEVHGVRRADGVLQIKVTGKELDAAEMLRREVAGDTERAADPQARPADIEFTIDRIHGVKAIALNAASGHIKLRAGEVAGIRLAGTFQSGQPLEVNYGVGSGSAPAIVNIETSDAGEFIRFLGLYARAHGGQMSVRAQGPDAKSLAGTLLARDFSIKEEAVLVRIAEATSGFAARRARDVSFSKLSLDFKRDGGAIEIKEALIGGPAVGASVRGRVDIAAEELGLSGTYIPAYGLNAAFGAIPLFGPILSGRTGEGVFGMTFGVEGKMANPTITINPMSTIAPGLLRRFFEFRQR